MRLDYDASKNQANLHKHGLSLACATELNWQTAITSEDTREAYGEVRYITYAMYANRLHCLIWTIRDGVMRPISLRKANTRERKHYEQKIKTSRRQ